MTASGRGRRHQGTALLGSAAVAAALAGCTATTGFDSRSAMESSAAAPAVTAAPPSTTPVPVGQDIPPREISCDVHTCTLTLRTTGPREVRALGATLSLAGVQDGVADLTVGDGTVRCAADESVHAGPLTLFCDAVTPESVTLTAEVS